MTQKEMVRKCISICAYHIKRLGEHGSDDVYTLTPNQWNPHSMCFAQNEDNMVDWEGNIINRQHRASILLEDIEDDQAMTSGIQVNKKPMST
jgi:hypothetical protein